MSVHVVVPFEPKPHEMQACCTDCGKVSEKLSREQANAWATEHERKTGHRRCG